MEYIYVNGVSARKLITDNANGVRNSNACTCWLSNPAAYPVYVETTNGSGLMIRLATAAFGTEFTITIKAGFRITNAGGELVVVTKDVEFNYNNASITKEVITTQYSVDFGSVTGATVTANGNAISSGDKLAEGTIVTIMPSDAYNVSGVTVNGETLTANNGVYTFTLLKDVTINVSATIKTYTATVNESNASVSGVSNNQTITHGQTYSFTVSVNSGYQLTSVTINGTEQGTSGSYSFTASGATSIVVTAKKLYSVTWSNPTGATISVTANGSNISSGATVVEGTSISVTATASSGYAVTSVTANGTSIGTTSGTYTVNGATTIAATVKTTYTVTATASGGVSVDATSKTVIKGESVTFTLAVPANATIKANGTVINGTSYTVSNVTSNTTVAFTTWYTVSVTSLSNASVTVDGTSRTQGWSELRESGTTITVQASYTQNRDRSLKVGSSSWSDTSAHTVTISGKTDISASSSNSCIVEGTLITLADGSQKPVEEIADGDLIAVLNHFTGKIEIRPAVSIAHAEEKAELQEILQLNFSNGTAIKMAGHHTFFDATINQYVTLYKEVISQYIGHNFAYVEFECGEYVQREITLIGYDVYTETVRVFSPASIDTANYFANGVLTAPPLPGTFTDGHMNYFKINDDMKYDEESMNADIEKYGLYTYEDFKDYIDETTFNAFPFKYFKISVEKGVMTWDEIMLLIDYTWGA